MSLLCLSLHHIKTPYADFLRFRLKDPGEFYNLLKGREAVLLQTGTRVEVYALIEREGEIDSLLDILLENAREKDLFDTYFDRDAVMHLFRLAGCIESKVYGETYIPLQVAGEFQLAQKKSATGPFMDSLFNSALRVARRARAETKIEGGVPVADMAVHIIKKEFPNLEGKDIVLLGAGLTGRKVAKRLQKFNPRLLVVNRNFDIGVRTASEVGGTPVEYGRLSEVLTKAELLICATLASHYRVTPEMLTPLKPLVIVDVSPFRNVDPAVATIPNVILKDGELEKAIEENMGSAKGEVPKVEKIIEEEIERLDDELRKKGLEPFSG